MGIFTRRSTQPPALALTPAAVAAVLSDAGFQEAQLDASHHPVTEGFYTYDLRLAEDRVAVAWHTWPPDPDTQEAALSECADVLDLVGYQAEYVTAPVADYFLVVWTEGEF